MKRKDAKRRWRSGMLIGITAMLVVSALALAACGGGSSSSEPSSTTSAGSEGAGPGGGKGGPVGFHISEEQRSCLKEKGVELPEFKGGEGGAPPQGFEPTGGGEPPQGGAPPGGGFQGNAKAFEECGVEPPEFKGGLGGKGSPPNMNSGAFKKQVKEYVACVREDGYELAEPNFSGEGPIFEKSESESAAFKQANAKCRSLLGGPGADGQSSSGKTEG